MSKLSFKLSIIYLVLVFINITFFTLMIFENQVDLIVDNAKFRTEEITDKLLSSLHSTNDSIGSDNADSILDKMVGLISQTVGNYFIYNEAGKIYASSSEIIEVTSEQIRSGLNAASIKSFGGKEYSAHVSKTQITYYIPFYNEKIGDITISFSMSLKQIDKKMAALYHQIFFITIVLIIIHILIALIINYIVVRPLMALKVKTDEFSKGNMGARVEVKGNDEIALVATTFNSMAQSVSQYIKKITHHNDLINMELEVAAQVQQGIYPVIEEKDELITVSVFHNPLEKVSGDFHDVIKLGYHKWGFFIADVSGHGVPAALITMKIKDFISREALRFMEPKDMLRALNNSFGDLMEKFSSYFTASYVIIDTLKGELLVSSAGHPELLILRKDRTIEELKVEGFVVGVSAEMSDMINSAVFQLNQGDSLIMYSDGITESRRVDDVFFGNEYFHNALKASPLGDARGIRDFVVQHMQEFTKGAEQKDDETLMIIEVKG